MALIHCFECGCQVSDRASSCPNCGAPVIKIQPKSQPVSTSGESSGKATAALTLGIVSMIAWLLPLIGYPVSIIGIIFGCIAVKEDSKNKKAVAGGYLSAIGFVLTLINSILGARMFMH